MTIMKQEDNISKYFTALKLIEQLYKDGHITKLVFRNILNDYANVVDLTAFVDYENKEEKTAC